ncbi:hypothetical protein OSTOST_01295 [Ostertagia ostertagi]
MECHYSNNDKATASGGADAPIPRSQGIGGKTLTGQKKEIPRLLTPKSKLRLGSWNVRTAFHCGQKEIIARELSKCRVTVAALSELRISGCGTTRVQVPATDDWMTLYYSGGQEHRDGVGTVCYVADVAVVLIRLYQCGIVSYLHDTLMPRQIYFKTIYEPAIMIVLMISNIWSFVVRTTWLKFHLALRWTLIRRCFLNSSKNDAPRALLGVNGL